MNKQEFLIELKQHLKGIAPEDISGSIEYYSEMIDDAVEDGMTEEEAVASLGDMDEIERQLRSRGEKTAKTPPEPEVSVMPEPVPERKNSDKTAVIILLIVCIPVIIGLLSAAAGIYLGMWGAVIGFYAAAVGMGISGAALIISSPFVQTALPEILVQFGIGMVLLSVSAPFFMLCSLLSKGLVELLKLIIRLIQNFFKGVFDK